MKMKLNKSLSFTLSKLAGAGVAIEMRKLAKQMENIAGMAPRSLKDLFEDDSIFYEVAVAELGSYARFLVQLITLFEKFKYETVVSSFYRKHLGEIAELCGRVEHAQAFGNFCDSSENDNVEKFRIKVG